MTNNVAAVKKAKVFCAINRVAILAHDDAKISWGSVKYGTEPFSNYCMNEFLSNSHLIENRIGQENPLFCQWSANTRIRRAFWRFSVITHDSIWSENGYWSWFYDERCANQHKHQTNQDKRKCWPVEIKDLGRRQRGTSIDRAVLNNWNEENVGWSDQDQRHSYNDKGFAPYRIVLLPSFGCPSILLGRP